MPTIKILFDDSVVTDREISQLGEALRQICLGAKNLQNVSFAFAYASSPAVRLGMEPIEVYVQITQEKIVDARQLLVEIEAGLKAWKDEVGFTTPINLTLMPMDWLIKTGI